MSEGSNNFKDESIEEERDHDFNLFEGLHISAIQQELVEDLQEIERGIGARVSTDPQDQPTAHLPPLRSPSQESSQLQREQDSNINLTERVIEEAPPTRMDAAARDGLETVPMVASLSTPEEKCSGMFKKKDPIKKELLALGACELLASSEGKLQVKLRRTRIFLQKEFPTKYGCISFSRPVPSLTTTTTAKQVYLQVQQKTRYCPTPIYLNY